MNEELSKEKAERADRFLIEDYAKWAESMYRSEEIGEKRINFFISLVTAVLAGLVALFTAKESAIRAEVLPLVTRGALAGLLTLGAVTFLRVLHRHKVTDRCKRQIAEIRRHFLAGSGVSLSIGESFLGRRRLRQGGLAVMMLVMNSILAGLFVYALVYDRVGRGSWGIGGTLVAVAIQAIAIKAPGWGSEKGSGK
jgi:hypothetical protein